MANPFIYSSLLAGVGVTALFTTRRGGVSPAPFDSFNFGSDLGDSDIHIKANLQKLITSAELTSIPHQVEQVHGSALYWASGSGQSHDQQADILLSMDPTAALAVKTADCLPVLLADAEAGIIAAVHAGWRGTAARIIISAVDEMIKHGAQTDRIRASLGPCIGPCCFEIGIDTADQLRNCCDGASSYISDCSPFHADLKSVNRLQLLESGLKNGQIESLGHCTFCQPQQYFSYRRDGKKTGLHLAVVALPHKP